MDNSMSGFDFFTLGLTLVFITLKLTKVINWSWWIVLLPMWGPMAIVLVLAIILAIIDLIFMKDEDK